MLYTYIQFANIQSTSNHNTTNTTISIIVNGVDGVASINPYLCAICFVMTSTPVGFPNRLAAVFPGKAINISTAGIPTKEWVPIEQAIRTNQDHVNANSNGYTWYDKSNG